MQRNARGVTLIEVLIVTVIIGILTAIAIPMFSNTKEKAYIASMKSDLRNLATSQEAYYYEFDTYTTNLGTAFTASRGVTLSIQSATSSGWDATASHSGTNRTCTIALGAVAGTGAEGTPVCS